MKKKVFFTLICNYLAIVLVSAQLPKLTAEEAKQGWILLFDGQTTNGWKRFNGDTFPAKGWIIENGVLSVDPSPGLTGDIVTRDEYSNFELSLEFRVGEGANSGIKYFVLKNTDLGCEYQILDDLRHEDAKYNDRVQGSLYDVLVPEGGNNKPVGQWNEARIIAKGKHVEHWLNGKKILEYERGTRQFRDAIAKSKFKNVKNWGEVNKGVILLQQHGGVVSFRNIKIRKL